MVYPSGLKRGGRAREAQRHQEATDMIKAEQDTAAGIVAVSVDGDRKQNEAELIAILISALDAFNNDDILEMLELANRYKETGEPFTGQPC